MKCENCEASHKGIEDFKICCDCLTEICVDCGRMVEDKNTWFCEDCYPSLTICYPSLTISEQHIMKEYFEWFFDRVGIDPSILQLETFELVDLPSVKIYISNGCTVREAIQRAVLYM
jgi:hypothetical protein